MRMYESLQKVYVELIKLLQSEGEIVTSVIDARSVGSEFGRKRRDFREIQGYCFTLSNPRHRVINAPIRRISYGFALANLVWTLCGRRDVESIVFYNSRGRMFTADGKYYESAFGDRIFGRLPQWREAVNILKSDPTSRRAFIPLFLPSDLKDLPLDTPCAVGFHLMIRDDKLDMVLYMRSQSAIMVFPYDIFLFTMLQELFSLLLGVPLGKFIYFGGSVHYYLDEAELGERILQEANKGELKGFEMPPMPKETPLFLADICATEKSIRQSVQMGDISPPATDHLPSYWSQVMTYLWAKGVLMKRDRGRDIVASVLPKCNLIPAEML